MILCQAIIKIIPMKKGPYKPFPLLLLLKSMSCNFFPEGNLMHKKKYNFPECGFKISKDWKSFCPSI